MKGDGGAAGHHRKVIGIGRSNIPDRYAGKAAGNAGGGDQHIVGVGVSLQMEFPRVHYNAFSPTATTFLLPLFMVLARLHRGISVVFANYLASFFEAR